MNSNVIWEEPPAPRTASSHNLDGRDIAEQLKARPGVWARVKTYNKGATAGSVADQIRRGLNSWNQPAGSFEAVSRLVDREHRVYARYVGPT